MAFMSQDRKKQIAAKLKPVLAKFGVKGSLAVRNHSTLMLTIKSGKIDFISDMNKNRNDLLNPHKFDYEKLREKYNLSVNPYWYHEHYTGKALQFFKAIFPILNDGNHDNSDIMTDYFDVGWYVDVNVGRWNQPYQLVK